MAKEGGGDFHTALVQTAKPCFKLHNTTAAVQIKGFSVRVDKQIHKIHQFNFLKLY